MPNARVRTIAGLLALALLLGCPLAATAQQSPAASLQALVGPSFAQLATLRGMASPGPPPLVVLRGKSETRRYVEQELNRKYPPSRLETERKTLVAWGLIPTDFDLRAFFIDLVEEQAAAYYDPVGKVMIVADSLSAEEQQAALLHELVHALQDRETSLERFLAPAPGRGDELLARQALVEGEAVALSLELLLKPQGMELRQVPDLSTIQNLMQIQSAGQVYARAPRFLQELLLFPYTQGLAFVHQWRLRQPWSAIGALYRNPPRSTAQILHPAKLLDGRQDPLPVALPDLGPALAPTWRRIDEDEVGEWTLGAVLERYLEEGKGRGLAAGWRGDRFQLWEAGDARLLVYRTSWETDNAAEAFARAYARLLEKKYPALAGTAPTGAGSAWSWQDGADRFLVERRGLDVLVLERVPASAIERVRQAVWAP